jgi:hypothetical protein
VIFLCAGMSVVLFFDVILVALAFQVDNEANVVDYVIGDNMP